MFNFVQGPKGRTIMKKDIRTLLDFNKKDFEGLFLSASVALKICVVV